MDCHKCSTHCSKGSKSKTPFFLRIFRKKLDSQLTDSTTIPRIALVGMPNVGKSVVFNGLTGTYVTVSNYPGTTVEVSRGEALINSDRFAVVDTPGMYSLIPITEEEKVARDLLMAESFDLVIHVIDAKNLGRMLPLSFQLLEAGFPLVLAINMMDEARELGLEIYPEYLEKELGVPVITMAAALNQGLSNLKRQIADYVKSRQLSQAY